MLKIKLETDPALVDGWCLWLRTRTREAFIWWNRGPRLHIMPNTWDEGD